MSLKATQRTHARNTELLRVRNIRRQRHTVPVPPQGEGARTRSSEVNQSSNVSAYMSVYVHAQASAASLQRTLNLSANKYYYYYVVRVSYRAICLEGHMFGGPYLFSRIFFPSSLPCTSFPRIHMYTLSL
jgi:hypothetical protein